MAIEEGYLTALNGYKFYSGGAKGADTLWTNLVTKLGAEVIVYRPEHVDALRSTDFIELELNYIEVVDKLGRAYMEIGTYAGKLVRRDMLQVKDASQTLAIASINESNGLVNGGTGYATTRSIILKLPTYCFDQYKNNWFHWDYTLNKFIECTADNYPKLITDSCLVGSRELNENGINAVKNIIKQFLNN
jgi:hypothetical protein